MDLASVIALAVLASLAALVAHEVRAARVVWSKYERQEPVRDSAVTPEMLLDLARSIDRNEGRIESLTLAVSDGIQRSDRAEKRIQKTVASAKRKLDAGGVEHAGLDAEFEALPQADGDPRPPDQLHIVPENVERSRSTGIPGLSPETLDQMMGA